MTRRLGALGIGLLLGACAVEPGPLAESAAPPAPSPASAPGARPLFDDLGDFHRPVTATSPLAQRYFDQGLVFLYGFDVEMAQRSFAEAAALDATCAMCSWGVAMALGPDINISRTVERDKTAYQATQEALRRAPFASAAERALLDALAHRYASPPPESKEARRALDLAYAKAMGEVARRFPDDLDAATLYAEAMMVLQPWDLWSKEGEPREITPRILATLTQVLVREPEHVGANHLLIHAVEASPHPEWASDAADRLRTLVPAIGHLLHMPSHIDLNLGRYLDAVRANERAVAADRAYLARVEPGPIFYMYSAHNRRTLSFAAMMAGQRAKALEAARSLVRDTPFELLRHEAEHTDTLSSPMLAHLRFGQWEAIVNEPAPPPELLYDTGIYHFTRGMAFAALGRLDEAAAEEAALRARHATMPAAGESSRSSPQTRLGIGLTMLQAAIAEARGSLEKAFALYRMAVEVEDTLRYSEPPDWHPPVRHWLGAALLEAGRAAEAEEVYREDLKQHRENGWALLGLMQSLRAQGEHHAAARAETRFEQAFAQADFRPLSSRD